MMAALRAFGAVIAMALGVLVVAAFTEAAIGEASAWWQWLIGLGVAGALGLLGGSLIYAGAASALDPIARAYLAWVEGRPVPGARGSALAGDLLVLATAGGLGLALFRHGVARGEDRWAAAGALLVLGGLALGLVPALPRAFGRAAARERGGRRGEVTSSPVAALATAAMIGMALAMAAASAVRLADAADGDVRLSANDWADGCVGAGGGDCPTQARLRIAPGAPGWTRVEAISRCPLSLLRADGAKVEVLDDATLRRAGVEPGDGEQDRRRLVFEAVAGERYDVWLAAAAEGVCTYSVRFLSEPRARGPR